MLAPILSVESFVDLDKARDFDTENNHKTRYSIKNFINVNNVYGQPDVTFVTGVLFASSIIYLKLR